MRESKLTQLNIEGSERGMGENPEYKTSKEVINHLLARQNLKPPFKDGKKIVGYFSAGFLTGVRGVGVGAAMQELDLNYAFNEIYGASSGFASASYFMTPNGPRKILDSIGNKEMIAFVLYS